MSRRSDGGSARCVRERTACVQQFALYHAYYNFCLPSAGQWPIICGRSSCTRPCQWRFASVSPPRASSCIWTVAASMAPTAIGSSWLNTGCRPVWVGRAIVGIRLWPRASAIPYKPHWSLWRTMTHTRPPRQRYLNIWRCSITLLCGRNCQALWSAFLSFLTPLSFYFSTNYTI